MMMSFPFSNNTHHWCEYEGIFFLTFFVREKSIRTLHRMNFWWCYGREKSNLLQFSSFFLACCDKLKGMGNFSCFETLEKFAPLGHFNRFFRYPKSALWETSFIMQYLLKLLVVAASEWGKNFSYFLTCSHAKRVSQHIGSFSWIFYI